MSAKTPNPEEIVYNNADLEKCPFDICDNGHGQDIGPKVDWCLPRWLLEWTTTPPTEIGHYWWRWNGQENAQGICELIEHNGEMYFAHTGFLAYENGESVQREYWPVRIEEPPR